MDYSFDTKIEINDGIVDINLKVYINSKLNSSIFFEDYISNYKDDNSNIDSYQENYNDFLDNIENNKNCIHQIVFISHNGEDGDIILKFEKNVLIINCLMHSEIYIYIEPNNKKDIIRRLRRDFFEKFEFLFNSV